jgi:cobalt-zinc-cadmium efflux system outer membrane protein
MARQDLHAASTRWSGKPRPWSLPAVVLAASATACASTSPRPAFDETARMVEQRTGTRIAWDSGGDEDRRVDARVRALLGHELTVDAAVEVALLENPTLHATYEDLSVAQADLVQAGLLQNPVLSGGVGIPVLGSAQTGVTLSVSQDFLSVFTLAARKRVARAELTAVKLRVGDAVLRTAYEVEAAYYGLCAAQQIGVMRRTILATAEASASFARRQREAGNLSDLDLANQEALSEQVRTDVVRSEAEIITDREALARLLGISGADLEHSIPAKLPELPPVDVTPDDFDSLAVGRRLDLGAAREETEAAAQALALATDFRWLGGTSVGGTYDHAPEGFTTVGPTASLELPIFDQKQAAIARLAARLRKARAHEAAVRGAVLSEVHVAWSRLSTTRAVVERYASVIVPLHERVVALAQEQYNAMLLGTPQLLLAKQGELNAYREFIEALRDHWTARADLERATGGALPAKTVRTPANGAASSASGVP